MSDQSVSLPAALDHFGERAARDLEAMRLLHRIGMLFVTEGDLEPILTETLDAAIAVTGADFGTIQLVHDKTPGTLRIVAQRGLPQWWIDFWKDGEGASGSCRAAFDRGARVIVENVEKDPIFADPRVLEVQLRAGIRAVQSTPMMNRSGKLVGVFSTHWTAPHRPDDHALCLLDLLAQQVGAIIEHREASEALKQRNRQLGILARASQSLLLGCGHDADERKLLGSLLQEVAGLLGADSFYLYRMSNDEKWLDLAVDGGLNEADRQTYSRLKLGQHLCGSVAQSRTRLIIEDLQLCPHPGAELLRAAGGTSYAGFPLLTNGRLIGAAAFVSQRLSHYREGDIETVQAICEQVATALERSRLIQALQASDAGRKEAEETLRAIADFTYDWESWIGSDGKPKWINPAVERMTGVAVGECLRMPGYPLPLVHPDDREAMRGHIANAEAGRPGNDVPLRIQKSDGTTLWASMSWQSITAKDGTPLGYRTSIRDISGRKRIEDALHDRDLHLRFALQASLAIVFEWDVQNDRVRRLLSKASVLPATGDDLGRFEDVVRAIHPDDRENFRAAVNAALTSKDGHYHSVHRVVEPDGSIHWLEEIGGVEFGEDGKPLRFLGIAHNIDERKRSEATLFASEERLHQKVIEMQAIFDAAPIGLAIAKPGGFHIHGNRTNEQMFGLPSGSELSKTAPQPAPFRVFKEGRELAPEELPMQRAVRGETVTGLELDVTCTDGRNITVYANARPLPADAENSEPRGAVGAFLDITDRKKMEQALRAAHETFRHLVERSPFGVYVVDADFRLIQVSDGAQRVFENVRPLLGRDFVEVIRTIWPEPFASEAISRFRHTLETGEPYHARKTIEKRADIDATEAYDWKIERIMLPDGRPGAVCHFYDLSERQRHEEHVQLLMREINHRSKNMLAVVQAIATLTLAATPEDFIQRFGERIRSLAAAHDLLVQGEWKSVPLSDLLWSQISHFASPGGGRVSTSGPPLALNPTAAQAIGMALHELATNSAKYGALSNTTGHVDIAWTLQAGDNGEPQFRFAWTEIGGPPVGEPQRHGFGSKVMTSMVESGVKGVARADFDPGGLRWYLTCDARNIIEIEQAADSGAEPVQDRAPNARKLGRRVLVVDDEPFIATEISAVLSKAGLDVVGPAGNVRQALALIADTGCDAAILDVNLGSETSAKIARQLSALHIPFITISGYDRNQLPPEFGSGPLLRKPLDAARLVESLKRCLAD